MNSRRIILASTSPRRIEILSKTNLTFESVSPEYEEEMHLKMAPIELVQHLAREKALSLAGKFPDAIIIGGDTLIALNKKVFGKPKTPEHAEQMLRELNGKMHLVLTGFTVFDVKNRKEVTDVDISKVYLKKISDQQIADYVATGEPLDKAAAYAIQGEARVFIEKIEGDFLSIMGLPLDKVNSALRDLGVMVRLGKDDRSF